MMAIEEFIWCPRVNAKQEVSFRVRSAKFGDGYQQVSGDGINPRSQKWDVEFTGTEEYIREIKEFLDRHQGVRSFSWRPPLEALGLYRCNTFTPTALGADKHNLSATFEQAFAP